MAVMKLTMISGAVMAADLMAGGAVAQASTVVPLPEARPNIAPARELRRHRHYRYHRGR